MKQTKTKKTKKTKRSKYYIIIFFGKSLIDGWKKGLLYENKKKEGVSIGGDVSIDKNGQV